MLNVYVVERIDEVDYDEYTEQTIVAKTANRALEIAKKEYGTWGIRQKVNLNVEQILTQQTIDG